MFKQPNPASPTHYSVDQEHDDHKDADTMVGHTGFPLSPSYSHNIQFGELTLELGRVEADVSD